MYFITRYSLIIFFITHDIKFTEIIKLNIYLPVQYENLHTFHIKRTYHTTLNWTAESTEKLAHSRLRQRIESSKWHTQTSTKLPQ